MPDGRRAGFFAFSQVTTRPDHWCEVSAFDTNRFKSGALFSKGELPFRILSEESVMHRNIRTATLALVLFISGSGFSLAAETAAPSTKGVGGDPTAEGIGNTSSTHNPNPNPASKQTGMENRGSAETMGTDTSTHNPTGKKD